MNFGRYGYIPVCHNISEVPKGVFITKKKSGCKIIIEITLRYIYKNCNLFFRTLRCARSLNDVDFLRARTSKETESESKQSSLHTGTTNTQILHTSFQNEDSRSFTCRRCRRNGNCYFSRRFAAWRRMLFLQFIFS